MGQQPSRTARTAQSQSVPPRSHQQSLVEACNARDVFAARRLFQDGGPELRNAQGAVLSSRKVPPWEFNQSIRLVEFSLGEAGADDAAIQQHGEYVVGATVCRERVTLLCLQGESIDALDSSGWTSLHAACYFCDQYMVAFLLGAGSDMAVEDTNGERPLHVAMWRCFRREKHATAIIQDLISHGDEWDAKCDQALTGNHGAYSLVSEEDRERWHRRVGPAIRYAALLWMDEHRLGLPLTHIPGDEIERGLEVTQTFVHSLKGFQQIVCRRIVCVVGPSTAGKTSLIKSLISGDPHLESAADATLGIDHFTLEFRHPSSSQDAWSSLHQVRFSDFAGQDVFQVVHSLFFTQPALFLITVDLNAYSVTLLKCEMLTKDDAKLQHLMNEYVDRTILSWIRLVMVRQPDAEFVFICTKEDTVSSGPGVDKQEVLSHVNMMLKRAVVIVQDMKQSRSSVSSGESTEQTTKIVSSLWNVEHECESTVEIIESSAATAVSAEHVRLKIERLIALSGRSYEMPERCMVVLEALTRRKVAAEKLPIHLRIQAVVVDVDVLTQQLQQEVTGLRDETDVKDILRRLRDCVDVLWYEDVDDTKLQTTVILDPELLIEFVREVINHNHPSGMISNAILTELPFWNEVSKDQDTMRSMKRLLQKFRLVHPASGDLAFDSDLIVPTYWKTKQRALWKFGSERLRLIPGGIDDEIYARRVFWELRFIHFIPDTLFDCLNQLCYSATLPIEPGPDWMLYRNAELAACRVVVSRHWATLERSLHIEAVLAVEGGAEAQILWRVFSRVCNELARTLEEHPGLIVTRFAHTTDPHYKPNLASIRIDNDSSWMPPEPTASKCIQALGGK